MVWAGNGEIRSETATSSAVTTHLQLIKNVAGARGRHGASSLSPIRAMDDQLGASFMPLHRTEEIASTGES